ncbi:MAG TPA: hypothetical protein VKB52_04135 [Rhodanobacteraceae bacterium]|nr:hypothetical protein [Rhodanobacteraceae bacterium]
MRDTVSNPRLTASDRPGVAQPVPVRDIPPQPWRFVSIVAAALFFVLLAGWERYWRHFGVVPSYRNSDGQWAEQRRRIDAGEGGKTVLIGASRMLFDIQLPEWERATGERPIQLAMEGTSPVPVLEDLAADPNFTGRLVIDVTPHVLFAGGMYRGDMLTYVKSQTPAQHVGDWLSMTFLEPYVAFYDPDFALGTIVQRQPWPLRPGLVERVVPRKLVQHELDRNTYLWDKVVDDPEYHELVRNIWLRNFSRPVGQILPGMDTPEGKRKVVDQQIARMVAAIDRLRARGVRVLFVRPPSDGPIRAFEDRELPRAQTWDLVLERTGTPGIHYEDYPELMGYELPEWSHLSAPEAVRFTRALVPIVEREFAKLETKR